MIRQIALGYLALASFLVGIWAQFLPESFYKNFPGFGHAWVSIDGPYNEHLLRDVGGLNIGLAIVSVLALLFPKTSYAKAAGVVGLVYGLPHFIYHLGHLSLLPAQDQIMNVLALLTNVIAALIALTNK